MRIGTISTSFITDEFIAAIKEENSCQLSAVYSRTVDKAQAFAKKHQAPKYFTNLEEMAKSDSIDCVYIASPNSMHYEHALLFLKHKKHVICEKPMFSNLQELNVAFRTAEENHVFLFEAMRNLPVPGFQRLKENLYKCGELRNVFLNYSKYSSRYNNVLSGEEPNIFSLDFSGGALVDLGVYPLTAAIALFGSPKQSKYTPVKIRTGVDGCGSLILEYDKFNCTIHCSKISTSYNASEIQGEEGTFVIDDMGDFAQIVLKRHNNEHDESIIQGHKLHDMNYEIKSFRSIIETNNLEKYNELKAISSNVLEITEKVRKENDIIYENDK